MLLVSNKLTLVEIGSGNVITESEQLISGHASINVILLDKQYAFLMTEIPKEYIETPPTMLTILDSDLKIKSVYNLNDLFESKDFPLVPEGVGISRDGTKIVCFANRKLQVYYTEENRTSTILDLSANQTSGLVDISKSVFGNNDKTIAIYGEEAVSEGKTTPVFGVVDIDGNNLTYFQNKDIDSMFQISQNFVFFDEINFPLGQSSGGQAYSINWNSQTLEEYVFIDRNESQKAFISPDGNKIVTVLEKNDGGKINYHYRVYDRAGVNLLKEWDTPFPALFERSLLYKLFMMDKGFVVFYVFDGVQHFEYREF
jgi:hypothetical protein